MYFVSPIHLTTTTHPVQGDTSPVAVQANKAVTPVETNFIDLPKDNQHDDGESHQGGQMKKSIQQLIKHNFPILVILVPKLILRLR